MILTKKDELLKIYLDKSRIINQRCKKSWGDYLMTKCPISGNGEIDYLRIYNENDSLVYVEEFNKE